MAAGVLAVADAASQLGVDASRVRQMLRAGELTGERLGRVWLVDQAAVTRRRARAPVGGRPLAPARAWALLDLVDGGAAPWLTARARSQVRALARGLHGAGPDRWRAALRSRSAVLACRAHPAALPRLLADPRVLPAGAEQAPRVGLDLVAVGAVPEVYVRERDWPELRASLGLREDPGDPSVLVRVPQGTWPFATTGRTGTAALAADLLESDDPRAVSAGTVWLSENAARAWRR